MADLISAATSGSLQCGHFPSFHEQKPEAWTDNHLHRETDTLMTIQKGHGEGIYTHVPMEPALSRTSHPPEKKGFLLWQAAGSDTWTFRVCVAGLGLMWISGLAAIVCGSVVQSMTDKSSGGYAPSKKHEKYKGPVFQLIITTWVTILSDIAGLIHSTSLRYALLKARKLTFNSNIRLFTYCPGAPLHSGIVNGIWAWSLISSYACASMVFLQTVYEFEYSDGTYPLDVVSGYALIFLGFGLSGQASIATWALTRRKFPTCSTNPIHVAAICQGESWFAGVSLPTISSVHEMVNPSMHGGPSLPKQRQESLIKAHPTISRALTFVWTVTILAFLWFIAATIAYQTAGRRHPSWATFSRSYTNDWSIIPNWHGVTAFLAIPTSLGQSYFSFGPWLLCKYLLSTIFTAGITLDLHIVELFAQCSRDESLWRQCGSRTGLAVKSAGAFAIACSSWQTITLFLAKSIIHWIFGLAWGILWEGIEVRIPQVCFTAISLLMLSVLATYLALLQPHGPQPATFGHLPTLVNDIDVWPNRVCEVNTETPGNNCDEMGSKVVALY